MKNYKNTITIEHGIGFTLLLTCLMVATAIGQAPAIEWQKSFGGSNSEYVRSVAITNDGGYVIAGASESNNGDVTGNHGTLDFWVAKISSSGALQWQKSLGGPSVDRCEDIKQTSDGGYILVGRSLQNGGDVTGNHGLFDYWVVKITSTGNLDWQRSLGGAITDQGYSVIQTSDGGYMVAGGAESSDGDVGDAIDANDYWIVKLSSSGNIEWEESLGGFDHDISYSVQQTTDGGYILSGSSRSNSVMVTGNHGGQDLWIAKISNAGILEWQKSYGGTDDEGAYSIIKTLDGGYAAAGYTFSNDGDVSGNHGSYDFWVIKIDNSGTLVWQNALGGSSLDIAYDIIQTADGGFVVVGETHSNNGDVSGNNGLSDVWLARLNASGTLLWSEAYGGSDEEAGYSLQKTSDGGFIFAATSDSNNGDVSGNHGSEDFWVVKLAPDPLLVSEFETNKYHLYPNPVTDILQIEGATIIDEILIFDMLGKTLMEQSSNLFKTRINMESYSEGTYFFRITSNNHTATYKIVKN